MLKYRVAWREGPEHVLNWTEQIFALKVADAMVEKLRASGCKECWFTS
jgi:hypothetical protein